jgi:intein/homing endonuclease
MPFNMDIWDGLFCLIKGQKVFTQRGEIPVEEIVIGDMVMSYNEIVKEKEWKIVENISNTQKEDLIEIITEKGNKLTLTNNHLVFTQRGWVKAGELSIEDELLEL